MDFCLSWWQIQKYLSQGVKFLNYLTEQLKRLGKSQKWLAEELGEGRTTVNAWCVGRARVPLRHRARLEELGIGWPYEVPIESARASGFSDESIIAATEYVMEACREAGVHAETLNSRGLGRLLAALARKHAQGDGAMAREALLAEAKDFVAAFVPR